MSIVNKRNEVSFEAIEMELTCHNIPIRDIFGNRRHVGILRTFEETMEEKPSGEKQIKSELPTQNRGLPVRYPSREDGKESSGQSLS